MMLNLTKLEVEALRNAAQVALDERIALDKDDVERIKVLRSAFIKLGGSSEVSNPDAWSWRNT